jgi:hypothetical protein
MPVIFYCAGIVPRTSGGAFIPDSGFTAAPVSTFAHTNFVDVTKTAGNFGTHGDDNPSAYLWPSAAGGGTRRRHLLMGAYDCEDGSMEKSGFQYDIDGSAGDSLATKWALSNNAPTNSTHSARRFHGGAEQGAINMFPPGNRSLLYCDAKFSLDVNRQAGKFWRPFFAVTGPSPVDIYNSTGCDNVGWRSISENFPGGDFVHNPGSPTVLFNPGSWDHMEILVDCPNNHFLGLINGVNAVESLGETTFPAGIASNHTIDMGHMVDNPDASRCAAHPTWDASEYWGPLFYDTTQNSFWIADSSTWAARTKWEMQVPITWGTNATTVRIALNRGELSSASFSNLYLYWRDASGTMTRVGRFPP